MARVYELACMRRCFAGWSPAQAAKPQEEMETALDLMEVQERRLEREYSTLTASATAMAKSGRSAEAKAKLRQRAGVKKSLDHIRRMEENMRSMVEFSRSSEVVRVGVQAMHSMAKHFNGSTANVEGMYKNITEAQDVFAELSNTQEDINVALQSGMASRDVIDDDDLEQELSALMEQDASALSPARDLQLPPVPSTSPQSAPPNLAVPETETMNRAAHRGAGDVETLRARARGDPRTPIAEPMLA